MLTQRPLARRRRRDSVRPAVESMERRELLTAYVLVDSPRVVEGTGGSTVMNFTVSLLTPSATTVTVDYKTSDINATAGSDYVPVAGKLTFAPGETKKVVPVSVIPDSQIELNESFRLNLANATNATIFMSAGTGTIIDDDTPVAAAFSIADVQMKRGLSGSRSMIFTVELNAALKSSVSVTASTANLTALAGIDYQAKSQVLTFAPGETKKQFAVTIYGSNATTNKYLVVNLGETTTTLARRSAAGILLYGA